jgi:hypothetical protein
MPTLNFSIHMLHTGRKKIIAKLINGSVVYTSHDGTARIVDDFYTNLLGSTENREHSPDLQAIRVPSHNLEDLDAPFAEKEVWETIKQLPSNKAPGIIKQLTSEKQMVRFL